MDELKELYQQVILDHNKNPRNFGEMKKCTNFAAGHNPLCGDQIDVFAVVEDGIVKDLKFNGSGCAISKASASIMTTLVIGKTIEQAKGLFDEFHRVVTSDMTVQLDTLELGKMAVFCGVREFPARVKCASLAWHTMIQALENSQKTVVTENLVD
ncbi:MAG: SUF system NifU family Fe-S cluster assembly protein [Candidatus Kapaibacterium sp.]|jgi:nitrogen fixation NifU-like protein|nr:SUF system NifU family Fe-S cluster assembly protein [Candidatus Kapabacteria bacterium]